MIYIFIALLVVLATSIAFICIDLKKTKISHVKKVEELNEILAVLMANNAKQHGLLILSDELKGKLSAAKFKVDKDIYALQFDLMENLSKNKLLE